MCSLRGYRKHRMSGPTLLHGASAFLQGLSLPAPLFQAPGCDN